MSEPRSQIIRKARNSQNPYAQISRKLLQDRRLSWEARGVVAYLFSKPDDWTVMVGDLIKQGNAGRDAMRRILKELEGLGYLRRIRTSGQGGQFAWLSELHEEPLQQAPCPENPSMVDGSPCPENPSTAEPSMADPSTARASITYKRDTDNRTTEKRITDKDFPAPPLRSVSAQPHTPKRSLTNPRALGYQGGGEKAFSGKVGGGNPAGHPPVPSGVTSEAETFRIEDLDVDLIDAQRSSAESALKPPSLTIQEPTSVIAPVSKKAASGKEPTPIARPPSHDPKSVKPKKGKSDELAGKYPPGVHAAMTKAVGDACYPAGGVPAGKWGLIGTKASEMLDLGYTPEDAAEVGEFLRKDPFWREKISPGVLLNEAPRWRSAKRPAPKKAAEQEPEEEVAPETLALIAELTEKRKHDPFAGVNKGMVP